MKIIESIYNEPEKWRVTSHTFNHKDGTAIWISNGLLFYTIYPSGLWGMLMKIRFHKAFKWWCENKPVGVDDDQ